MGFQSVIMWQQKRPTPLDNDSVRESKAFDPENETWFVDFIVTLKNMASKPEDAISRPSEATFKWRHRVLLSTFNLALYSSTGRIFG